MTFSDESIREVISAMARAVKVKPEVCPYCGEDPQDFGLMICPDCGVQKCIRFCIPAGKGTACVDCEAE